MRPTADVDRTPVWHILVLAALATAQIACGILTGVASSDTNRDIYFAQQIASGASFPLTGPAINGMMHLGPLWYYLLAVPLLLIPNAAAATGAMAAIAAMQYPLAYRLGRRFGSAREALLFALALAVPGWNSVAMASLTHPIAAAPSLLLGVCAALHYRDRPSPARALLLGLSFALMMTAHPTLVLFALLLALWSGAADRRPARWIAHAAIALVPVLLALAPVVFEQWRDGFADAGTAAAYAQSEWSVPSPFAALELVYAILCFGPKYVAYFLMDLPRAPAHALLTIYGLLVVSSGAGLVLRLVAAPSRRALIAWIFALLLLQSAFVCAIRTTMPPWMVYAQWPLVAALLALGLDALFRYGRLATLWVAACLLVTSGWSLALYGVLAEGPLDHAEIKASPGKSGLMDIRDYEKSKYHYRLARIPFRDLFALGNPLCEPVALYGHYAYLVDYTYAVSAAARCGTTATVHFGGMPETGRIALFGLHESAWKQIGLEPESWIAELGIGRPVAIWHSPRALEPVVPRLTNFPRTPTGQTQRVTIRGDASPAESILVAHRGHRYVPFEVLGARADGKRVDPVYADETTAVFRAPAGSASETAVHWEIEISAWTDYVDVLTFASN